MGTAGGNGSDGVMTLVRTCWGHLLNIFISSLSPSALPTTPRTWSYFTEPRPGIDDHYAMASLGFYEQQLLGLGVVCVLALMLDRYVSNSAEQQQSKAHAEDRLESGKPGGSALAMLTRKYLLVYAIVMGEFEFRGAIRPRLIDVRSCGLAARPLCVLALPRAVRVPGAPRRCPLRHRLRVRRLRRASRWSMG